mmetsp:Transcript_59367/g.165774  ORF Transcript_59367/g.165774 Transcript_59367/m.165774 type:complete len:268 (-) Transcript_59367:438-1241(-)
MDHLHRLTLLCAETGHAHAGDDLLGAKPKAAGIHRDMLQAPKRTEGWPVEAVVDHEVMHQEPAPWTESLVRVLVELYDDRLGNGARDVGHQHDVEGGVAHWPRRTGGVQFDEADAFPHIFRLLRPDALAGPANLRQLQHCRLQAWRVAHEDVRERARAPADVKHVGDPAQLELFLNEVFRRRGGTVVLGLCVRRSHLGIREPRRVARRLAACHDGGKVAHGVVKLAADLEFEVIPVEVPCRRHHVLLRVRRECVTAVCVAAQALDGG